MPTRAQDTLLDRYQLLERLGSGGFSVVDLAWDTRMQRRVAIKRMQLPALYGRHQSMAESDLPGLAEARAAAMLSNPHIVTMFDFEVSGNEALLIMEHIDGLSLRDVMEQSPELLDTDIVAAVVAGVGDALAFAHANQVLHLDIKPDNIMIDHSGTVKVTDFGLAEFVNRASAIGAQGGSIGYMPLEQMAGEGVTEQTDEWALASVVYEVLTGENPFECSSIKESADVIEHAELIVPSAVRPDIAPEIDDIVFQALSIEPFDRYSSIKKFVTPLKKSLGNVTQGKKKLRTLVTQRGIIDTATLDPTKFDENGIAYEPGGQAYYSGLDDEDAEDETAFFDDDGVRYYKDDAGDPYYLDEEGAPFYYDQDRQAYYFDENGRPYRLDRKGRVVYIDDVDANGDGVPDYATDDSRRKRHRTVALQRKQDREKSQQDKRAAKHRERDAKRRKRRTLAQATHGCIGQKAAKTILRVSSGISAVVLASIGFNAIGTSALSGALSTLLGNVVPGASFPLALTLLLALIVGVVAAFWPVLGLGIAMATVCLGLIACGWILVGFLSAAAEALWLFSFGRADDAACDIGLLAPALGMCSLGFLQPLLSGYLLDRKSAFASSAAGALSMLVLAPLTCMSTLVEPLFGIARATDVPTLISHARLFQVGTGIIGHTALSEQALLAYFSDPGVWVTIAAWVLSAVCVSLLSTRRGNLASSLSMLIAVLALALAMLVAHALDGTTGIDALFAYSLAVPLVLALLVTWLYRQEVGGAGRNRARRRSRS